MAKYHGLLQNERANPTLIPVVDIATTDSGVLYGDKNIMRRLDLRLGPFFECDIVRFIQDEREILYKD
jgi:hypothetical protein